MADDRGRPNERIMALRKLFSFVNPPVDKRLDGRNGEIDSEICDAVGQMAALGLFDGHGHDPVEMVRSGRFWGCHYAALLCYGGRGAKVSGYERGDKSENIACQTKADIIFDRMNDGLGDYEREVLITLLVDPLIGTTPEGANATWADALIAEGLRERGRLVSCAMFPSLHDRELLNAAIRGLCALVDGQLPARFERRAA
jgi:hypothetical protein